jgi:hypothetical protein
MVRKLKSGRQSVLRYGKILLVTGGRLLMPVFNVVNQSCIEFTRKIVETNVRQYECVNSGIFMSLIIYLQRLKRDS